MQTVILDYETFTDRKKKYYLGKSPNCPSLSEYIHHPWFKVHGASLQLWPEQRKPRWLSGTALVDALSQIDWTDAQLLCHNTAFDGAILNWHFGHVPAFYLDTLSMARPLYDNSVSLSLDALGQYLSLIHI